VFVISVRIVCAGPTAPSVAAVRLKQCPWPFVAGMKVNVPFCSDVARGLFKV